MIPGGPIASSVFERATATGLSQTLSSSTSDGALRRLGSATRSRRCSGTSRGTLQLRTSGVSCSICIRVKMQHRPALAVQGRSPAGETGAITRPSEPPLLSGGVSRNSCVHRPQAACHQPSGCVARACPLTRQQGGAATACTGVANPSVDLAKGGLSRTSCPSWGDGNCL